MILMENHGTNGTAASRHGEGELPTGLIAGLEARAVMIEPRDDPADARRHRLALMTSEEFARRAYRHEWLVEQVLVKGQPAVFGGPRKTLKTSLLIDLALSLAAPRTDPLVDPARFLGRFAVPARARVGLFSGESGQATLQETAHRICAARGTTLKGSGVLWNFAVPHLADALDLEGLQGLIRDHQLGVVIIDPLYLALPGGGGVDANNLFAMGSILNEAARACLEAGATPILAHHARKHRAADERWEPLELEDLAYAGIQEFARQWVLVSRRARYVPGTGSHRLWMSVGGSAGFGGLWGVDVEEGQVGANLGPRSWRARVLGVDEARLEKKRARAERKENDRALRDEALRERVEDYLRDKPEGDTRSAISSAAGGNTTKMGPLFAAMLAERVLEEVQVKKGRGERVYEGLRLATGPHPVEDDQQGG
jgi:hypothetical protein